jgi:hypothetical protein
VRALVANAIIIIFIILMTIQPAAALTTISIPFVSTGCTAFMEPLANTACTIEEFNSASAFANSAEALDISFPLSSDNLKSGSTTDGSLTSNAVSFGPVDLAFPSIKQAAFENTGAQRTYFFTDTF